MNTEITGVVITFLITILLAIPLGKYIAKVFNGEKTLRRSIESVFDGDVLPEEVLIVDDGSVDGTGNIIEELRARHSIIRCLRLASNCGLRTALNAGLEAAAGDALPRG